MKPKIGMLLLLALTACGQDVRVSGGTKNEVVVNLGFIEEIKNLCRASVPPDEVESCTLKYLNLLLPPEVQ